MWALISSSFMRNFSDFLYCSFGNLRIRSWAMIVYHYCNACYSWCVCRLKCCSCFQWNDQNIWRVLFAKTGFHMAQVVQSNTTLCHREGVVMTFTQIRHSLCRRNTEDHWNAAIYTKVLCSKFCWTTWVGGEGWVSGGLEEGKIILYNTYIHTYIHSMDP